VPWACALLGRSRIGWVPVRTGESGDHVYRREDGLAYAKIVPAERSVALAGERDRLVWLHGLGFASPRVVDWREAEGGSCLSMSTVPGIPASELAGPDLLRAWPSIARQIGALHELPVDQCPFDRGLRLMFDRATDVVADEAVNPEFLPPEDRKLPAAELLARIAGELPIRLAQEAADRVVCHGDACMPNIMVDPETFRCTGLIDLGRLGTADRYVDLALMVANASESWAARDQAERASAILFETLEIEAPDRERLAFYPRLDPLTWAGRTGSGVERGA
jgi:streptomycin 3"-kinase